MSIDYLEIMVCRERLMDESYLFDIVNYPLLNAD